MKKNLIFIVTLITIFTFFVSGCSLLDNLLSLKEDFKKEEEKEKKSEELSEIIVETPELSEPLDNNQALEQPQELKTVLLYYGAPDGKHLVSVEKEIPKCEGIARATLNALLEGPEFQSGLLPVIPAGTTLLDINVKEDGLCIVDFSKELISNMTGGEVNEKLAVYSIVNTLCQFPTVDRVEFRVEGQRMDTLLGHVSLKPAVAANAKIVQGQK